MILGTFSSVVTVKGKQLAWEWVQRQLTIAHPEDAEKTVTQVKKKWENLMGEARKETGKYLEALRGTGKSLGNFFFAIFFIKLVF